LAVYVLAVVAFAVMLYLSFRTLGMAPVSPEQGAPLLERLCTTVAAGVQEIATGLTSAAGEGAGDVARDGRKRLTGYEQQMARLDVEDCDPGLLRRRDGLSSAVETLSWACRMAESPHYHDTAALQRAVHALAADALTLTGQVARK
jgi:hypothetical protein